MTRARPPRGRHEFLAPLHDRVSGQGAEASLARVAALLERGRTSLLASHANPDGDALGSLAALALGLRSLGKEARALIGQPVPEGLASVLPGGVFELHSGAFAARADQVDCAVLLDTSEPARCGVPAEALFVPGASSTCLDHHATPASHPFDAQVIVEEAPATGCLVLALLDELGVALTEPMARSLWVAIATDTGWFRFQNTGAWALLDASRLARCGLDVAALHRELYASVSLARLRILGRLLEGARSSRDGRFVWGVIDANALRAEGVAVADLDGMVDHLKSARGAEVVALIVEAVPGQLKVSLRATGEGNVEAIARGFGGGGHVKAAGFRYDGDPDALLEKLAGQVEAALPS